MSNIDAAQDYFDRTVKVFFQPLLSAQFPDDRKYGTCHMWVKSNSDYTSTIGIDHIGAHFLQPMVSVVLPQTPSRVEYNSPFAWLVLREGTIALRSAISGIAVGSNVDLLDHPCLLLDDPYESGWILRIKSSEPQQLRRDLRMSEDFTPLVHKEIQGVREKFNGEFRKSRASIGPTLNDGGEPVKSIQEILGQKKYFEIISQLFSKM